MAQLKIKTEWDLSPLLKSDNDPSTDAYLNKIRDENYKFINKWKDRNDYLKNPEVLKEALDEFEKLLFNYGSDGNVGYYFGLRSSIEQDNKLIKAKVNQLTEFATKIENDIDFFTHRIARITEEEQQKFLESSNLSEYKHFLEGLFENAKYLLSEKEEKILNLKAPVAHSNWVRMVSTFISKEEAKVLTPDEKKEVKSFAEIMDLMRNPKKNVRDKAALEFNKILAKHVEVAENEINSILQNKKINDDLRGFERPDQASFIRDDMESTTVDTLIETVQENFLLSHRYYELKSKLLGLKKLKYHERNVTYGEINKKYKFDESVELVYGVFQNLDKEFSNIFKEFVERGRIDAFPKKGKRSGAFCASYLNSHPSYIMLNHNDLLDNVLTIAHEAGHGIHHVFASKNQNALNSGLVLSTAEVASTFMEDFVLQKLLADSDEELRLALMVMTLDSDITTIIRQIACIKFEQELHRIFREKGYLAHQEIGELFKSHMQAYMGDFVEQSSGSENWWVYWGHIRSFFYNYTYASGLLISKALQNKVKKDKQFIENVKGFLSAGTSKAPRDIFLDMGIDISKKEFWQTGLNEVKYLLNETEKLAKKLNKI